MLGDEWADAVTRRQLLLADGEWEAAEASWAQALDHDVVTGNRINATVNACWLGQTQRLLGKTADAVAALDHGLATSLDGPFVPGEVMARAELTRVLAALGEHDEAADAAYARAGEVFTAYRLPWWRAQTLDARAWAHAAAGRTDEARASERAAAECYDALGAAHRQRAAHPVGSPRPPGRSAGRVGLRVGGAGHHPGRRSSGPPRS